MSDIQRNQYHQQSLLQVGAAGARVGSWNIRELLAPVLDPVDGAAHIYVSLTGSDDLNSGLGPTQPFRTIQHALDVASAYVEADSDFDIVIEVANGAYAEAPVLALSKPPQREIVVRGDRDAMTVLFQGTCGAGTNNFGVTDPGAAFGAADNLGGLLLRVFDPANPTGTQQWCTIWGNTGTRITPTGRFNILGGPVPQVGTWQYQVLRPGAIVAGTPVSLITLDSILPWQTVGIGTTPPTSGQSFSPGTVWLEFLQIGAPNPPPFAGIATSLRMRGGQINGVGLVCDGVSGGILSVGSTLQTSLAQASALHRSTGFSYALCGIGVRATDSNAVVHFQGSKAFLFDFVSNAPAGMALRTGARMVLVHGAIRSTGNSGFVGGGGNCLSVIDGSTADLGDIISPTPQIPVLFAVSPNAQGAALRMGNINTSGEIAVRGPVQVRSSNFGIFVNEMSNLRVDSSATATITSNGPGSIAGRGAIAINGGRVSPQGDIGYALRAAEGGVYPTGFVGGETLTLDIDGGGAVVVVFAAGDQTAAQVRDQINAAIPGVASVVAGELVLRGLVRGAASSVDVVAASAPAVLTTLGLTIGVTANGLYGTVAEIGVGYGSNTAPTLVDSTWTAIAPGAPLVDANSGARIYRSV